MAPEAIATNIRAATAMLNLLIMLLLSREH